MSCSDDTPAPTDALDTLDDAVAAAAFRRLVRLLQHRSNAANIDLMGLAGFCRNCLSNWYREAANEAGVPLDKEASRKIVYGMPYKDWQAKHQTEATAEQKAKFAASNPGH